MTNIFKAVAVLFFAGMTAGGSTEVEALRLSQVSLTGLKKWMGMMERTGATATRKRLEKAAAELDVFVAEGRKRFEKAAAELDVSIKESSDVIITIVNNYNTTVRKFMKLRDSTLARSRRKMSIQILRNLRILRKNLRKNLRILQSTIQFRRRQAATELKNVQAFEKKAVEREAALERKAAGLEMNAVTGELERVIAEAERQQQQIDSILEKEEEGRKRFEKARRKRFEKAREKEI